MCGSANYGPGFGWADLMVGVTTAVVNEAVKQSEAASEPAPTTTQTEAPTPRKTQPSRSPDGIANQGSLTSVRAGRSAGTPFARPSNSPGQVASRVANSGKTFLGQ